jgi:hypothetical protein
MTSAPDKNDQTNDPLPNLKPAPNETFSEKQPNNRYAAPKTTIPAFA